MNGFRKGLFATIVAIAFPLTQAGATTSTFDGTWNVRISSSSETCGNGATVAIGINNGQIASSSAAVSASGRVADAGSINVTLSTGIKRAVGFGRLSGTSGSGTWRGGPLHRHVDGGADLGSGSPTHRRGAMRLVRGASANPALRHTPRR
ncbi:hypothetical protein [Bradyrhizobium diazoefficiens]|uniref:hypothetical protein n=1 Tax=Bradyrhizobium diazoefficiens TaxID=1355477 RepID=UPI00349B2EC8